MHPGALAMALGSWIAAVGATDGPAGSEAESGAQPAELELHGLPDGLLWRLPIASPEEARLQGKLTSEGGALTFETAIGAAVGLLRYGQEQRSTDGAQLSFFAVVFTRFSASRLMEIAEYRAGLPIELRWGAWQAKLAYEHSSSHVADQLIQETGIEPFRHVRDDAVLGLARELFGGRARVYGQIGYAFHAIGIELDRRDRFQFGAEWMEPVPSLGEPSQLYAALDVALRGDQDHEARVAVQFGWQYAEAIAGRDFRIGLEYFSGRSTYGQFYRNTETWAGFVVAHDW